MSHQSNSYYFPSTLVVNGAESLKNAKNIKVIAMKKGYHGKVH